MHENTYPLVTMPLEQFERVRHQQALFDNIREKAFDLLKRIRQSPANMAEILDSAEYLQAAITNASNGNCW